jgi:hypothetical protein
MGGSEMRYDLEYAWREEDYSSVVASAKQMALFDPVMGRKAKKRSKDTQDLFIYDKDGVFIGWNEQSIRLLLVAISKTYVMSLKAMSVYRGSESCLIASQAFHRFQMLELVRGEMLLDGYNAHRRIKYSVHDEEYEQALEELPEEVG